MTSSVSRERARAAAREADLAQLKVKQLREKAQLEAKIAARKSQLNVELAIQKAENEAGGKEIEALLFKKELDEYDLSDRMKGFEDNSVGGDNVKIETMPQVKQKEVPINDIKDSKQKVKKWLKTVSPKEKLMAQIGTYLGSHKSPWQARKRYHHFLWRGLDVSRPPEVYEAMRLMFGDRASPYLTHYVVLQYAEDNRDKYPLAVAIILLQMYMDDIMTSLETDNEAIKAGHQFRELLLW